LKNKRFLRGEAHLLQIATGMKTQQYFGSQRASWLVGLLGLSLAACQKPAPVAKEYPYLIKVQLTGCKSGDGRLYQIRGNQIDDVAKVVIKNGQAVFRGKVAHPGVYWVSCSCGNKGPSHLDLYLPADSINAVVTPGSNLRPDIYQPAGLGRAEMGSYNRNTQLFSTAPQQREVGRYLLTRDSLWNKYFLDLKQRKTKMDAAIGAGNKPEIDRWADSTRRVQEGFPDYMARASALFVERYPHSAAALFALRDAGDMPVALQRLRPYYQALPDSVRNSYFGQRLASRFKAAAAATSPSR
jgi:hypothetical protein